MGDVAVSLDLQGRSVRGPLDGLYSRLSDLTIAMEKAGALMLSSVAENFAAQGRPDKWQGLAPSTVEQKGHGIILVETGRLMSSIRFSAGPDSLLVSAEAPYAGIQQEGGDAGSRQGVTIPARPFMLLQETDVQTIKDLVGEYISGAG